MRVHLVWILLSLLCFLPWDSGQQDLEPQFPLGRLNLNCSDIDDCDHIDYSSCIEGYCECEPGYRYSIVNDIVICTRCPGLHDTCVIDDCCFPPDSTECRYNVCQCTNSADAGCGNNMEAFRLATQIALGSALILAIACLLAILWKSCKRRREIAQRMAGRSGDGSGVSRVPRRRLRAHRRTSSQTSLSSGQLRVAELLRDRPPGYHDRTHIRIEKPPTYEETLGQPQRFPILNIDVGSSLTPPFPAADSAPVETPEDSLPSYELVSRGVDNAAFVIADEKSPDCDNIATSEAATELHM